MQKLEDKTVNVALRAVVVGLAVFIIREKRSEKIGEYRNTQR